MSVFPKKVKVKIGAPSRKNQFDLSHIHDTTTDFYQLGCGLIHEIVPDTDIKLSAFTYTRLEPLVKPTLGVANFVHKFFFVPYNIIDADFDAFQADSLQTRMSSSASVPSKSRCFTMFDLIRVFRGYEYTGSNPLEQLGNESYLLVQCEATDSPDFARFVDWASVDVPVYNYFKLTNKGRRWYRLLSQLGYKLDFSVYMDEDRNYGLCAYSLLALAKVYIDHIYNYSYYGSSSDFLKVRSIVDSYDSRGDLTWQNIYDILNMLDKMYYPSDYFTSAFDNPVGGNNGVPSTPITVKDVSLVGVTPGAGNDSAVTASTSEFGGTPVVSTDGDSNVVRNFTQYIDTMLKRVTDYVMRNRLVGARVKERLLGLFGVEPTIEKLKISRYLGESSFNIKFGDVFSNSDTAGAALGDYAGKGEGNGSTKEISFHADSFGVVIDLFYVIPRHGYYQGIDRRNFHISKFDFWHGDYDNVGAQMIAAAELVVPEIALFHNNSNHDFSREGFGFNYRYSDYKYLSDKLTGDFAVPSYKGSESAWHFMRLISPLDFANKYSADEDNNIVHSEKFTQALDRQRYDNCFTTTYQDNFKVIIAYDYKVYSPMKSMYDTYDFDSEGKQISMFLEGSKN